MLVKLYSSLILQAFLWFSRTDRLLYRLLLPTNKVAPGRSLVSWKDVGFSRFKSFFDLKNYVALLHLVAQR